MPKKESTEKFTRKEKELIRDSRERRNKLKERKMREVQKSDQHP